MESLLCNEVLLMSPDFQEYEGFGSKGNLAAASFSSMKEDLEEAFGLYLRKEARFLPEQGYLKLVMKDDVIRNARVKAVYWIIKTQRRMDLSLETVFIAVNYLDRFISARECHGWKSWMFELLYTACLSVASKFNETTPHLLSGFQMEDRESSFDPNLIQRMELTLLKVLDWRMDSTTPFSYIHLLVQSVDALKKPLIQDVIIRVTELLVKALSEPRFLEFQQCVIAMSAVKCVLLDEIFASRNNDSLAILESALPQELNDDLMKCQIIMKKLLIQDQNILVCGGCCSDPSSPVTVLKAELFNFYDYPAYRLSHSKTNMEVRSNRKRKRREVENRPC